MSILDIREKVQDIQKEVIKYDSKSKAGNQNCLLCAWAVEAYFRGVDILPRPVYSPRDIIFKKNGYDIIKDPIKIQIKNKNDAIRIIKNAGDKSRFYIHVKWSASTQGGHEFNLINFNSKIYLIDGQAGLICLINSQSAMSYFDGIDFFNSYMVRLDDKESNPSILKYNKIKYLIQWDDSKDIPYIAKHELVSESLLSIELNETIKHL